MNQWEREDLFREEEEGLLQNLPEDRRSFSPHGNHKRSLCGSCWYYIAESEYAYNLFHDEVVGERKDSIWLKLWMDGRLLTENLVHITREQYNRIYPVQDLFPHPMEPEEVKSVLREYFHRQEKEKERSTTTESMPNGTPPGE